MKPEELKAIRAEVLAAIAQADRSDAEPPECASYTRSTELVREVVPALLSEIERLTAENAALQPKGEWRAKMPINDGFCAVIDLAFSDEVAIARISPDDLPHVFILTRKAAYRVNTEGGDLLFHPISIPQPPKGEGE